MIIKLCVNKVKAVKQENKSILKANIIMVFKTIINNFQKLVMRLLKLELRWCIIKQIKIKRKEI